ncbi:MAG: site-specific integrase [Aureispira sp.]|nr:site-specific integrase [Aureispira sp.]
MGIKVTLRKKVILKGRESLYLDFYPAILNPKTGKTTRREFLKLYIHQKPRDTSEKNKNKENLALAKHICQKRENELNKPEIYTAYEKERLRLKELGERDFISYFEKLTNKRIGSNKSNWASALHYLKDFTKGSIKFSELNESIFEDFKDYLLKAKSRRSAKAKIAHNTAVSYFNKVKAALKQAFRDNLLQTDLNAKIASIKEVETIRAYLTKEELNQLIKTKCNYPLLKQAALFSALTGLRFSDIQKMVWGELEYIKDEGYSIKFKQQKTKGVEFLPISKQAYDLLGAKGKPNQKVFEGLKYSAYHNKHLFQWIGAAGITKDITFHCFRHTYAVLQLLSGTDIYTLSKLLGHRDLKTTLVYAKIVDATKRTAANKIQLDFDND